MANPLTEIPKDLIAEHAFRTVMWVGVCLCICAAVMRLSIRLACFQKLHTEDVLMIVALSIMITNATVLHIWIGDIYTMIHVQNGYAVSFDFLFERIPLATRATGIVVILSNIGIWTIKLNFMAFFYRLGHQIKIYRICWWVALAGVVGCGVAVLGVVPYHCLFGNIVYIVQTCLSTQGTSDIYSAWKAGIAVDVVSDVIILCFPIIVLWKTKIALRQKLVLSSIFSLVVFTITITIMRGSIMKGGVYQSRAGVNREVLDITWMLFWIVIQYCVSFIIACLISFRSLWTGQQEKARTKALQRSLEEEHRRIMREHAAASGDHSQSGSGRSGSRAKKWKLMYDSLMDTLHDLEGTMLDRSDSDWIQMEMPGHQIGVDFSKWDVEPMATVHTRV